MKPFKYELGIVLKDIVTGFKGVAMSRTQYYTGCNHYGLCPQKYEEKSKLDEWVWFDESRLIPAGGKKIVFLNKEPSGGPHPNAPKM